MVVRFDFEDSDEAVADIHHAGVLAGPLHHVRAARRQLLQVHARGFVRAVLAPHHAEDAQLGEVRIAPQDLLRARVFVSGEAVFCGDLRGDFNLCVDHRHGEGRRSGNSRSKLRAAQAAYLSTQTGYGKSSLASDTASQK